MQMAFRQRQNLSNTSTVNNGSCTSQVLTAGWELFGFGYHYLPHLLSHYCFHLRILRFPVLVTCEARHVRVIHRDCCTEMGQV